jgi:hypothetical protein
MIFPREERISHQAAFGDVPSRKVGHAHKLNRSRFDRAGIAGGSGVIRAPARAFFCAD